MVEGLANDLLLRSNGNRRMWVKKGIILEQFYEAGTGEEGLGKAKYFVTCCTHKGSEMKNRGR